MAAQAQTTRQMAQAVRQTEISETFQLLHFEWLCADELGEAERGRLRMPQQSLHIRCLH